jgi:nicotinate-nucleotide adenylyltransferase
LKFLILGGSFNPVHLGHLVMAQEARIQFGYDFVAFVPSLRPPHKNLASDPGWEQRLAMLELALRGDPAARVDDCEIRRGGTSYSIDTIRHFAGMAGIEGKPGLLLGDDLVPGFPSWRDPDSLAAEADIVCAHRSSALRLAFPFPHRYADNPLVAVSSSLVRSRIEAGLPFRYLVPDVVHDYIVAKGLYGAR